MTKPLRTTIDRGCLSLGGSNAALEEVWAAAGDGRIALYASARLILETQNPGPDASPAAQGKFEAACKKIRRLPNIGEPGVYGLSVYGQHARYCDDPGVPEFARLASTAFPEKWPDALTTTRTTRCTSCLTSPRRTMCSSPRIAGHSSTKASAASQRSLRTPSATGWKSSSA